MTRRLLAGVSAIFALALTCSAAPDLVFKTACPNIPDYEYVADLAVNSGDESKAVMAASFEEALADCTSDPTCTHFNTNAEYYTTLAVGFSRIDGVCTYFKIGCPSVAGYKTLPAGSVFGAYNGASIRTAADAETACKTAANCFGFTTDGSYVITNSPKNFAVRFTNGSACAYVKDVCPRKFGFESYADTALVGATGLDGITNGNLGDIVKAEAYCKITPKCSGYSSDGSYYVGGITNKIDALGTCSYIKNACPPVVNYTAYEGTSNVNPGSPDFQPDATYSSLCFADMARNCSSDSNCVVFDTLRNTWDIWFAHANPFPGMCTYVKVDGLFPGLGNRRRRSAMATTTLTAMDVNLNLNHDVASLQRAIADVSSTATDRA